MIYITGDCHGEFGKFSNRYFHGTKNDVVIVTGDFGLIWDGSKSDKYWTKWFEDKPYTILFVVGNHENFNLLEEYPVVLKYGGIMHQIGKNIFHMIRGQIYAIQGNTFFAFGGARSHDVDNEHIVDKKDKKKIKRFQKNHEIYRVKDVSWWEKEYPTEEEMRTGWENLESVDFSVDYIISHECPDRNGDTLQTYFQKINENCTFQKWFFGHYHLDENSCDDRFTCIYNSIIPIDGQLSYKG